MPLRCFSGQHMGGDLGMNSLWTGSTWLITTASTLSPLIALFIGFAGTDRLLRRQFGGEHDRAPSKGAEASGHSGRGAPARASAER